MLTADFLDIVDRRQKVCACVYTRVFELYLVLRQSVSAPALNSWCLCRAGYHPSWKKRKRKRERKQSITGFHQINEQQILLAASTSTWNDVRQSFIVQWSLEEKQTQLRNLWEGSIKWSKNDLSGTNFASWWSEEFCPKAQRFIFQTRAGENRSFYLYFNTVIPGLWLSVHISVALVLEQENELLLWRPKQHVQSSVVLFSFHLRCLFGFEDAGRCKRISLRKCILWQDCSAYV